MPAPPVRAVHDLVSVGVLMAALILPGLGLALGLDAVSGTTERRRLAEPPATPSTLRAVREYPRRFDRFIGDRFGFRRGLLRLYNQVAVVWLRHRPAEAVGVIAGQDGWLYYTGDDALRFLEGRNLFQEDELRAWERCLRDRGRWLSQRGIRYLVVFAPDKGTIYPEHLPEWVRPSVRGTRLDQLIGTVSGIEGVEVLDLRRALLDAKQTSAFDVYAVTDTHWNALGMHAAYAAIVARLGAWFPGATPAPLSSFELRWERRAGGDLAETLGLEDRLQEDTLLLRPGVPGRARPADSTRYRTSRRWLSGREPVVTAREDADISSAVIFRDSFTKDLIPLLSEHFGRAVFLWSYDFDCDAIEREHPSVVIQEYAERVLSVLTPVNPPQVSSPAAPSR